MQNKIKLQGIGIVLLSAVLLTGCLEQRAQPNELISNSVSSSQDSSNTESNTDTSTALISQESNSDVAEGINIDVISELGMTYSQLTEKYGEPHGTYNEYDFGFGVGYGRYIWKSDEENTFDDIKPTGGCNFIAGIKPENLFFGFTSPMDFDELTMRYGFVPISFDSEISADGSYWAEFTYPLYDSLSFIFSTRTYGSIDENTKCSIIMNVDCLKAIPVV